MKCINSLKVLNSEQTASPVACRFLRDLRWRTRSSGSDITRMCGFVILAFRAPLSPLLLDTPECAIKKKCNACFFLVTNRQTNKQKKKLTHLTLEFALQITNLKFGKASVCYSHHTHNVTSPPMHFSPLCLIKHN